MKKIGWLEIFYSKTETWILDRLVKIPLLQYKLGLGWMIGRYVPLTPTGCKTGRPRWSDRPLDGTFESYVHAAKFFPAVWLIPLHERINS